VNKFAALAMPSIALVVTTFLDQPWMTRSYTDRHKI
jgi:hypothetical protein